MKLDTKSVREHRDPLKMMSAVEGSLTIRHSTCSLKPNSQVTAVPTGTFCVTNKKEEQAPQCEKTCLHIYCQKCGCK